MPEVVDTIRINYMKDEPQEMNDFNEDDIQDYEIISKTT